MSDAPPVLTKALETLLRTHVVAVHMEMLGYPPPNFPSGQIPVLMEHLPSMNLTSLLSGLRATAERLVAEDDREIS